MAVDICEGNNNSANYKIPSSDEEVSAFIKCIHLRPSKAMRCEAGQRGSQTTTTAEAETQTTCDQIKWQPYVHEWARAELLQVSIQPIWVPYLKSSQRFVRYTYESVGPWCWMTNTVRAID